MALEYEETEFGTEETKSEQDALEAHFSRR
jgi:hypothetical protein